MICQGCGTSIVIPSDYSRSKIQCPGCGVICPIAPGDPSARVEKKAKPSQNRPPDSGSSAREEAIDKSDLIEQLSQPGPLQADPPPTSKANPAPSPRANTIRCRRCGRLIRRQRECPNCDRSDTIDRAKKPNIPPMETARSQGENQEEDTSPYSLVGGETPSCPRCHVEMTVEAVVCTSCGFDLRTRKRTARTYQPLARSWETNMPLGRRITLFFLLQLLQIGLTVVGFSQGTGLISLLCGWLLLTLLTAFLLGTYERLDMIRDERGKVTLTRRWRIFFIPWIPDHTEARGFEGITTAQTNTASVIEWFVFVCLLIPFILPGVVFWFVVIYKPHYQAALARNHGRSEFWLYRGRSEEQMEDITESIGNASGLQRLC